MTESTEKTFEQAAAFQKIWLETFNKMAQAGFSFSPDAAPPEFLRQMRSGIFQALSRSWEEFMRSPQFLDSVKMMMENAIAFRQMSNELLTQARHSVQGPARSDIDDLMQAIHHLETRILDRVEELSNRLNVLENKLNSSANGAPAPKRARVATSKRTPKRGAAASK